VSCASITCAPAGLSAAVRALSDPAEAEDLRRFENQPAVEPTHLILLKGGTIIGMDPKVGDLVRGDLLIEGTRIAAIAPELAGACVGGTPRPSSRRLPSASLSREQMYASGCPSVLRILSGDRLPCPRNISERIFDTPKRLRRGRTLGIIIRGTLWNRLNAGRCRCREAGDISLDGTKFLGDENRPTNIFAALRRLVLL
jgi:hypothetical protein